MDMPKGATPMHIRHDSEIDTEIWRDGVETRMYASAPAGCRQITVFEQWCVPGTGAPLHVHAVEEVLRIVEGQAEVVVGTDREVCAGGCSIVIPAGAVHGFTNTGSDTLRVLAVLASPIFEARYVDADRDVRRWTPE